MQRIVLQQSETEFDIIYGRGISAEGELLDIAVDKNIVEKSGSWFSYGEERIGQGRENAKAFLRAHPDELKIKTDLCGLVQGTD